MTEQSAEQVDPAVERGLESWAGSTDDTRTWVAPEAGEESATAVSEPPPLSIGPAPDGPAGSGWNAATSSTAAATLAKLAEDRPELAIGGAFLGGFLLAAIIKRIAR